MSEKKELQLTYDPQPDISLFELSKVIVVLLAVNNGTLKTNKQATNLLDIIGEDAARHFKLEEVPSEPSYT